jgi:nicotinamide-nucleotide adenylyltransferase
MIEKSLDHIGLKNYRIVMVPDIHNPPKWVDHVLSIISDFDIIISNNSLIQHLFSKKGYQVKNTPMYNKDEFSGREIRTRMISAKEWTELVPDEVVKIIKDIGGIERIKRIIKK